MTDEISTPEPSTSGSMKSQKPSRKFVAVLAASILVLAGGITVTSVSIANAAAEETARQCAVALKRSAGASKSTSASLESAHIALEAVTSVTLPGEAAWTSTDYAARPGVEAIRAVLAVEAELAADGTESTPAVAGVDAVAARASGAELIEAVAGEHAALAKTKISTACTTRDEAAQIASATDKVTTAANALDASTTILLEDFTAFQTEETTRIAAEIEAARVAAEAEAARVAAEAEAARVAAEAAARAAAQRPTTQRPSGGGSSPGGTSGGSGRPPGGSFQVGPGGGNNGVCWTTNGMGGQKPCGT